MPRKIRSMSLETRSARLRLEIRKKPYGAQIGPGLHLQYRRNHKVGRWIVKARDGAGGYWTDGFAYADDVEAADGAGVLDFWQAIDHARALARGDQGDGEKPISVAQALDQYETDLQARGGDKANATRVRSHLTAALAERFVSVLTAHELRRFRDALLKKGLARDSINRVCKAFKAALNSAADRDMRITSRMAWKIGLAGLPEAGVARNVILPDEQVLHIIDAAYGISTGFGLLVEVAAITGARTGQIAALNVRDLQDDHAPRLMMPGSKKGSGQKKITHRPVPIPQSLAAKLRIAAAGRAFDAPLLLRANGARWRRGDHTISFARTARAVGLDPAEVTIYSLRHSAIVRELLANVPIRIVAVTHDTSTVQIERTYSARISDHADAISRRALLDPSAPVGDNVTVLRR
jgi:integrase